MQCTGYYTWVDVYIKHNWLLLAGKLSVKTGTYIKSKTLLPKWNIVLTLHTHFTVTWFSVQTDRLFSELHWHEIVVTRYIMNNTAEENILFLKH